MTSPRDALIAAIEDALPYSQDFSRQKAERVVAAMEGYFVPADNEGLAWLMSRLVKNAESIASQPKFVSPRINLTDEQLEKLYKPNGCVFLPTDGNITPYDPPTSFQDGPFGHLVEHE